MEDGKITVTQTFVNHDRKNRRIDVIGDSEDYIIVINGKPCSFKLIEDFRNLDSNALYRFANSRDGIVCEKVHVIHKDKEKLN